MTDEELIIAKEAARRLGLKTDSRIRQLILSGKLPACKMGTRRTTRSLLTLKPTIAGALLYALG